MTLTSRIYGVIHRPACVDPVVRSDRALREEVLHEVMLSKSERHRPIRRRLAWMTALGLAALMILMRMTKAMHLPLWGFALATISFTVVYMVAVTFILRRLLTQAIRQEVLARGVPICLGCGYDLRGGESAVCPECGTDVSPAVQDLIDMQAKCTEGEG